MDSTQEKLKNEFPAMQRNLHELEMKHAWLVQEAEKLKTVIEQQRGAIMWTERLLVSEPTGSSESVSDTSLDR